MANFGTIKAYNSGNGNGTIAPEQGGEPLHFGKDDVQQQAAAPEQGQRWSYDTRHADGAKIRATNLRHPKQDEIHQQGDYSAPRQQAH